MRLDTIAADNANLSAGIVSVLPDRLIRMRDEMNGQPRAAHLEPSGGSQQWCWTHEREVRQCHDEDLDCTGETFTLHDPTGEAAVGHDAASSDHRELQRHMATANRSLDRVARILAKYEPVRTISDRNGIGSCSDCHRYFDGARDNRISSYKGGDPVCAACRARRDRAEVA